MLKGHGRKMQPCALKPSALLLLLSLLTMFARAAPLHGAESPAGTSRGYALARGTNEFAVWAGGSPGSSQIFGNIENRNLLLFALRYGRVLAAWESISLQYTLYFGHLSRCGGVRAGPCEERKLDNLWSRSVSVRIQDQLCTAELDTALCSRKRWVFKFSR